MKEEEENCYCQYHANHWNETWVAFNAALRSTEDFHVFRWTLRLLKAGFCYSYVKFGLYKLKVHVYWRSWVPAFAIVLIVMVVASYYGSLREIVKERWCCATLSEEKTNRSCRIDEVGGCRWLLFHDFVVAYLGLMIIFNFLSACFRSPGVVLAKDQEQKQEQKQQLQQSEITHELADQAPKESEKWTSRDSRGGFCCIDPILNIPREECLVRNYYGVFGISNGSNNGNSNSNSNSNSKNKDKHDQDFPSCLETLCNKCKTQRPPRCHHCSICNRCILQFDHHCVWLNNCVGYNNHRAFLLTLFYLSIGCWYGWFMLYRPFLELLKRSHNDHGGWHFLYDNKKAFLDLPPLTTIFSSFLSGTLEKEVIIKLVFPFLTAIGFLQTIFFGYHLLYVVSALTTLEYKILLDMQYNQILEKSSSSVVVPPNPFSRGWSQNLKTALGPIPLIFLPVQVDPKPMNHILNTQAKKAK